MELKLPALSFPKCKLQLMLNKNFNYFYIKVGKINIIVFCTNFKGKLESCVAKDSEALVPGGKEYLTNY